MKLTFYKVALRIVWLRMLKCLSIEWPNAIFQIVTLSKKFKIPTVIKTLDSKNIGVLLMQILTFKTI